MNQARFQCHSMLIYLPIRRWFWASLCKNVDELKPRRRTGLRHHSDGDHHGRESPEQSRAGLLEDEINVQETHSHGRQRCEAAHAGGISSSGNGHYLFLFYFAGVG